MSPAVIAAMPLILDLISKGVPAVIQLINWVAAIRIIAQQSEAWTKEMEEAFIASLIATKNDPAYAVDSKPN